MIPSAPTGGWPARLAIARRDLVEFVRDRRALFITLVMPMAMYPLLALSSTLGIRTAILDLDRRQEAEQLVLAFSGEDAEAFGIRIGSLASRSAGRPADWPETIAMRIFDADEALAIIDEGVADAWIAIPRGSIARLDGEGTLPLEVRLSNVRPPDRRVKEHVLTVLRSVADEVRLARLERAGLPASLIEPLRIDFTGDQPAASGSAVREILPTAIAAVLVLLALLTATGAFYPAIDAIAGEKERGTIETLLIAPCSAFDIVAGKFVAVFAVTLATLVANAVSIALTTTVLGRFLPAGMVGGLPLGDALACAAVTLVAYVGLAAVAAALCLTVTAASKSAKEAQNTLTPVVMLIAALAGSALLPGSEDRRWLPAIPFAGQVAVARSMLSTLHEQAAAPSAATADAQPTPVGLLVGLAISVASSAAFTWLLLLVTASLVSNEEILFRGPDTATRGFRRPPPRSRPTPGQGLAVVLMGFAALWYAQGLAPEELVPALLVQQAMAVLLPLLAIAWWQRVDARDAFALRRPADSPLSMTAACAGGMLVGVGIFFAGAAAALAFWQDEISPEARRFAGQIVELVRGGPAWRAVLILAVMPAVCEELCFRGWVLSAFAGDHPSRRRAVIAVVAQAAAFAAFHLLPERMPQTFLMGLALGGMTLATRSILPAIVAHAAHNATPVLLVARSAAADLEAADGMGAASLPPWAVMAAIGCLITGGGLLAASLRGRPEKTSWM